MEPYPRPLNRPQSLCSSQIRARDAKNPFWAPQPHVLADPHSRLGASGGRPGPILNRGDHRPIPTRLIKRGATIELIAEPLRHPRPPAIAVFKPNPAEGAPLVEPPRSPINSPQSLCSSQICATGAKNPFWAPQPHVLAVGPARGEWGPITVLCRDDDFARRGLRPLL